MNNVKLELINYGYLDVEKEIPMTLNFNLNDIRDISNRGGVFSKTIKLPGTANNNSILGNIFNVNLQTLTFNPNLKEHCKIIVDGLVIFEGVFQVRKIVRDFKNSQDFKIVYECYIKSDTSSFYNEISGKYLTDLDLSQYGHTHSLAIVQESMDSGTWLKGYQYYLNHNDNNFAYYYGKDFVPAIYAKTYWDNIFNDAGYTYEWDEQFPLNFDKMIIPYNGESYKPKTDDQFKFRAGFTDPQTQSLLLWRATSVSSGTAPVNTYSQVIIPDDDSNFGENLFDNDNRYNINNGRYDVEDFYGVMEFNLKFYARMTLNLLFGVTPASDIVNDGQFELYVGFEANVMDSNGNIISQLFYDPNVWNGGTIGPNPVFGGGGFNSGDRTVDAVNFDFNFIYDSNLYLNASYIETKFTIFYSNIQGDPFKSYISLSTMNLYNPRFSIDIIQQNSESGVYENTPDNQIGIGAPITMAKLIPKQVKQSDFILSIVKMFNLYITEDKHDPTKLIIKTRDKFYEDGSDIDWTSKLDINSVETEMISNTQKKRKIFTYKEDTKDVLGVAYKEQTSETFGQLEYVFENEFIKDIDKVEPIFSPSIIVNGAGLGSSNYVPYIDSESPKNNIRILYSGDVLSGYWEYIRSLQQYTLNTKVYTYRYAGHLWPNPNTSNEDLNFGVCDYYIHNYTSLSDNNLYNRFYRNQMNIFENGHIMTANFKLTYKDILTLNMNSRIYVYDSWWNINKIFDYDLNSNGLTKVELITSDPQAELFTPNNDKVISNGKPNIINGYINGGTVNKPGRNILGSGITGVFITGDGNIIQPGSHNDIINGSNNKIDGSNNMVSGTNSSVFGNNNFMIGTNNGITGNNSFIVGNNVTIATASNIFVVGYDGYETSVDNTIQLGGPSSIINIGTTGSIINFGGTFSVGGYSFDEATLQTTDGTITTIISISASVVDNVSFINADITGVKDDGSAGYYSRVSAGVKNNGGTLSLLSKTDVIEKTEFSSATSDIYVSGNDILVRVTGEAATTINWICNVQYRI